MQTWSFPSSSPTRELKKKKKLVRSNGKRTLSHVNYNGRSSRKADFYQTRPQVNSTNVHRIQKAPTRLHSEITAELYDDNNNINTIIILMENATHPIRRQEASDGNVVLIFDRVVFL